MRSGVTLESNEIYWTEIYSVLRDVFSALTPTSALAVRYRMPTEVKPIKKVIALAWVCHALLNWVE
jgi:hypothetical protein